jgi:hypothetical protein
MRQILRNRPRLRKISKFPDREAARSADTRLILRIRGSFCRNEANHAEIKQILRGKRLFRKIHGALCKIFGSFCRIEQNLAWKRPYPQVI